MAQPINPFLLKIISAKVYLKLHFPRIPLASLCLFHTVQPHLYISQKSSLLKVKEVSVVV
jgi:hypothetical protein